MFFALLTLFIIFLCSQARENNWCACYSKDQKNKRETNNANSKAPKPIPVGYYSIGNDIETETPKIPGLNYRSSNDTATAKPKRKVSIAQKSSKSDKRESFASTSAISMISQVSIDDTLGAGQTQSKTEKK